MCLCMPVMLWRAILVSFCIIVIKYLDENDIKENGSVVDHRFRVQSIMVGKHKEAAGHIADVVRKQRDE